MADRFAPTAFISHPLSHPTGATMEDDPMARLRAEMDQANEGIKEYVKSLWTFYSESVSSGFTADQALTLTLTFMTTQMGLGGDVE